MNSLLPSASRRAATPQSAINHPPSTIGGPAAYFSTLATRPSTGSLIPAFSSSAPRLSTLDSRPSPGFTLIELLVVISIIAILAGLAFPAVNGALNSARKAQARNDVQQIVAAVKAFQAEYGRMPTTRTPGDPTNEGDPNDAYHQGDNDIVMRILMAQETGSTPLNAKRIVFLDAKTTTTQKGGVNLSDYKFYDPWGTPYAIKLDNNYTGKIEYYGSGNQANIFSSAMAVSAGPGLHERKSPPFSFGDPYDATDQDGKDDICSFK